MFRLPVDGFAVLATAVVGAVEVVEDPLVEPAEDDEVEDVEDVDDVDAVDVDVDVELGTDATGLLKTSAPPAKGE